MYFWAVVWTELNVAKCEVCVGSGGNGAGEFHEARPLECLITWSINQWFSASRSSSWAFSSATSFKCWFCNASFSIILPLTSFSSYSAASKTWLVSTLVHSNFCLSSPISFAYYMIKDSFTSFYWASSLFAVYIFAYSIWEFVSSFHIVSNVSLISGELLLRNSSALSQQMSNNRLLVFIIA